MKVLFLVFALTMSVSGEEYKIPQIKELSKDNIGVYNGESKGNTHYFKEVSKDKIGEYNGESKGNTNYFKEVSKDKIGEYNGESKGNTNYFKEVPKDKIGEYNGESKGNTNYFKEVPKDKIGEYNGESKGNTNYSKCCIPRTAGRRNLLTKYNEDDYKYELGNPDDYIQYIEKPCNTYDAFCIRRFFAQHSHCKESYGPVPNPLYRAQSISYLPRINLTVVSLKQEYTGVNGRVVEFYINKKTDKLVLAVEFTNFGLGSNENYFKFHQRGREPIVNMGALNVTYASIVSTIIIPNLKDLQFERSEVFTYNNDVNPQFSFGLSAFAGSDAVLRDTALAFLANYADNIREGQLTDGPFFIASYIKYYICDFGIEVL